MNSRQRRKVRRDAGQPWTVVERNEAQVFAVMETRYGERFFWPDLFNRSVPLMQLRRHATVGRAAYVMRGGV